MRLLTVLSGGKDFLRSQRRQDKNKQAERGEERGVLTEEEKGGKDEKEGKIYAFTLWNPKE